MKLNKHQFLGRENIYAEPETARYAILPIPFEGAVSYGVGAANAPAAIIEASQYLEYYDEILKMEPFRSGVITLKPTPTSERHAEMHEIIVKHAREIVAAGKTPIILGGDHSVSSGVFRALREKYETLSCIQIDAHSDLRDSYLGSPFSHASVMARIREMTPHVLQLGIRSMSAEEAKRIDEEHLAVYTMDQFRRRAFDLQTELDKLPEPVYITFDVDAFDWSVVWSTGTPEPGGFSWDEAISLLDAVFRKKRVVGFDVVELAHAPFDRNSPFAVAKLVYKMIALHIVNSGA